MPKKKAAPADNTALWIGLAVGGAVVVIVIIGVLVGVYVYSQQSQQPQVAARPDNAPPPAPPPQPPKQKFKDIGDKPRPANSVRARADRPKRLNELRQIALFYLQYRDTYNRSPATPQDFAEYIKRDSNDIKQAIDEKYYIIVANVRAGDGVVAYEFDPDANGRHGVALMSGTVNEDLSSQQLDAQLRAQGNPR